jgi:nitrite reductase (NADH) small subunit
MNAKRRRSRCGYVAEYACDVCLHPNPFAPFCVHLRQIFIPDSLARLNMTAVGNETRWIEVGALDDIPRLGARVVRREGGDIALFRNGEDEVFALLNRCPHKGGPLSEGIVYGRTVACPLHNWCLDLRSGQARGPDEGCAQSFPVRVEGGRVWLSPKSDAALGQERGHGR